MTPELQAEIERLRAILAEHGQDFLPVDGAEPETIRRIEEATGIRFDTDVRDFYRFSNGSGGETWGAAEADGLIPLCFPQLEEAYENWTLFDPYDRLLGGVEDPPCSSPDPRIQGDVMRRRGWFPLGESDGYAVTLFYDTEPAGGGRAGQIIVGRSEPCRLSYAAGSFVEFLRRSNELLEAHAAELLYPALQEDAVAGADPDAAEELKALLARSQAALHGELSERALVQEEARADTLSVLYGHDEGLRLAFEVAVVENGLEVARDLLARGAAVNVPDPFGVTPLMVAASCGYAEMVGLLLEHGADPSAVCAEGRTAADRAAAKGHEEVVRRLAQTERQASAA